MYAPLLPMIRVRTASLELNEPATQDNSRVLPKARRRRQHRRSVDVVR